MTLKQLCLRAKKQINHLHTNPSDGHPSNHQSMRKVKNFTTKNVPENKKKTWACENSKSKEIDDDVKKEVEETPNAPDAVEEHSMEDAEEVDESQNNGVCQQRMEQNRKKKACCAICTKEDGHNKKKETVKKKMTKSIPKYICMSCSNYEEQHRKTSTKSRKEESSSCYIHKWAWH